MLGGETCVKEAERQGWKAWTVSLLVPGSSITGIRERLGKRVGGWKKKRCQGQ